MRDRVKSPLKRENIIFGKFEEQTILREATIKILLLNHLYLWQKANMISQSVWLCYSGL
jgi:hypothetical protein